jgi:hypothetical protein
MRPQIAKLEEELTQTEVLLAKSRETAQELHRRLFRAPADLVMEAQRLVAGGRDAQVMIAWCWSRIDHYDRCKIIPILATVVADELDRAIGELRVKVEDIDKALNLLDRVRWLMHVLTPDSGATYAPVNRGPRQEWEPLEASYLKGAEWVDRCGKLLELRESRSTATAVVAATREELSNPTPSLLGKPPDGLDQSGAQAATGGAGPAHHPGGYFDAAGHRMNWPDPGESPEQTTAPPSEQG